MRYLFHNVYGDADQLIDSAPTDVQCVPFGWDEVTELERNELISELGITPSCLPSVIYLHPAYEILDQDDNGNSITITFEESMREVRVADMDHPWSWEAIDAEILSKSMI